MSFPCAIGSPEPALRSLVNHEKRQIPRGLQPLAIIQIIWHTEKSVTADNLLDGYSVLL